MPAQDQEVRFSEAQNLQDGKRDKMVDHLIATGPVVVALLIYFVRLETRITKILTDLCWMKKALNIEDQKHADSFRP